MKKNMFLSAALEEFSTAPVGVAAVHELQTLQPKPTVKQDEDFTGEEPVKAEVGEDHPFAEHDEIDTVAESQETTLALEHLSAAVGRFMAYGAALEEIADTVEENLEAGKPLEQDTAALLTTAIDGAALGEPMTDTVALESFDFSLTSATESFIEDVKVRAEKAFEAVAAFMEKAFEVARAKLKRFADYFVRLRAILKSLEKDIAVTEGVAGKNFEDAAREKKVQKSFISPASAKTPLEVLRGATAEMDQTFAFIDGRLYTDFLSMQKAVSSGDASQAMAAMNKVLSALKTLVKDNQAAKFTTVKIDVALPSTYSADGEEGTKRTKVKTGNGSQDFDANLKIAGSADLVALNAQVTKAHGSLVSVLEGFEAGSYKLGSVARKKQDGASAQEHKALLTKYRNLVAVTTELQIDALLGSSHGLYYNFFAATGWVRASIAEARSMKKAA